MDEKIEVTIGRDGKVTIHVQGVKGTACTGLTGGLIARLGGRIEEQEFTLEAYEQPAATDVWATWTKEREDA